MESIDAALPITIDMIASITEFFNQFIDSDTRPNKAGGEHSLQIATAALLMEMMRMDDQITS